MFVRMKSGGIMDNKKRNATIEQWKKTHVRKITFAFNLNTDQDILKKLDSVPNKQGYIKELIRKDIK